jgi:hypothetical protein
LKSVGVNPIESEIDDLDIQTIFGAKALYPSGANVHVNFAMLPETRKLTLYGMLVPH